MLKTRANGADFAPAEKRVKEEEASLVPGCERHFLKELDSEQRPWKVLSWGDWPHSWGGDRRKRASLVADSWRVAEETARPLEKYSGLGRNVRELSVR